MSTGLEAASNNKSPPAELRGEAFGRYRLLERIGAGGMAEIYRAVAIGAQGFERMVAIKRIREEVGEVADIGKLFADEARLSALLNHPNIVQVYDFGSVDGTFYIAMEYLKGQNLDQVLFALRRQGERLDPALAVFIAHEVARALAYAHALRDEQGRPLEVVHRDVSPANVMLLGVGGVKLLDFGIARITSELRQAVTQGRALRGKCPYLAPEQISGGAVDGRSDIFALGVVLWEMLTGERLFAADSDLDSIASVMNREILPPSVYAPEVTPTIDRLVLAMLARDPERRYRSAEVLAADLDEAMRALPSRQRDLPALLRRLFPSITGELPTLPVTRGAQASGGHTLPRFAVEVPSSAGPRPIGAGPRDLTVPAMNIPAAVVPARLVSASVAPAPAAPGYPPAGSVDVRSEITAKITPVGAAAVRPRAVPESNRSERPSRPGGRRALVAVLGTVVATELLAALLNREFSPLPASAPSAAAAARTDVPPIASERCPPPLPPPTRGEPPAARASGARAATASAGKRAVRRPRNTVAVRRRHVRGALSGRTR